MPEQPNTAGDDLEALIATEVRLEQLLEAARADASARLDRAHSRAAENQQLLQARIDTAVTQLRRDIDATTLTRIERERSEAAADLARYEAVSGVALDELAAHLAEHLVALILEGAP